jgi:ribonuclease-3
MDRRAAAIADLEGRLGYCFADRALLERALTHASVGKGAADNERLEFLGDRVLALIIAGELMARDEAAKAGVLSKKLHVLVSRDACAAAARGVDLGAALRLPGGETRRGARDHSTILADACEALIAALYIELGLDGCREVVLRLWAPVLAEPLDTDTANPKSALQEWAAARGLSAPAYRLVSRTGPDHEPRFVVAVDVEGLGTVEGAGGSRQLAEKAAAGAMMQRQAGDHA